MDSGHVQRIAAFALTATGLFGHCVVAHAEDDGAESPVRIEVVSVRIGTLRNPEIQFADDIRECFDVALVVRNTGNEPAWFHWTAPHYVGNGRFRQHAGQIAPDTQPKPELFASRLNPAQDLQVSMKYPVLWGHTTYETMFGVAFNVPKADAERLRRMMINAAVPNQEREDSESPLRLGIGPAAIKRLFEPVTIKIPLPTRQTARAGFEIECLPQAYRSAGVNQSGRRKTTDRAYRFTNHSMQPLYLLVDKATRDGRVGHALDLRWSDRLICIRKLPTIHFIEIASRGSIVLRLRRPSPSIGAFAYAEGLAERDIAALRALEGKLARTAERKWVIEHTTAVAISDFEATEDASVSGDQALPHEY